MPRRTTLGARLARMGFADPAQAERLASGDLALDIGSGDAGLMTALATAADPDLALAALARMPRDAELLTALHQDADLARRLALVLGASAALGDHLARHPEGWRLLRGPEPLPCPSAGELRSALLTAAGADPGAREPVAAAGQQAAPDTGPAAALRVAYRQRLLHLAARDLTGQMAIDDVAAELADLAAAALEAALAISRSQLPAGAAPCRLAVIAMGKCGGRELNYASDVDVIFVAEPAEGAPGDGNGAALHTATQLAAAMIRVCSQSTAEGILFPVDPNLRPEGRDGPLVRTLASHRAYYERWAKTWEFQALLKARPVAGDPALGAAYAQAFTPLVWQAAQRDNFVEDSRAMRRRVISSLPARPGRPRRQLGPGGLRDIEFAVQLLQLVHGRGDDTVRSPATLPALAALADGGYVGRADAASLATAYRFLRSVEHLLQLRQLRRTHTLPDDPAVLRRLGRALRTAETGAAAGGRPPDPSPSRADPAAELTAAWRRHAAEVRRLHEKLFYRPLLEAVARLPSEAARLTPEAAQARLEALGYADPAGALRHIEALTSGVSRRAAIQRTLLPVMLGWFADAASPDAGLRPTRSATPSATRPGTCGCCGTTPWSPAGWPGCWPPAGTRPTCCCGSRRWWPSSARTTSRRPSGRRPAGRGRRGRAQARQPAGRGRGGTGAAPPRAAPHGHRRPARPVRGRGDRAGTDRRDRGGRERGAAGRGQDRRGQPGPAAHPAVRGGDGPLRRARDRLRQRRGRDVRARPAARRR